MIYEVKVSVSDGKGNYESATYYSSFSRENIFANCESVDNEIKEDFDKQTQRHIEKLLKTK